MGYISLQFDKVKGTSDTRMSEHIERKTMPSNADRYFPYVRGLLSIARECQGYGFSNEMVLQLVHFKPVPFKGSLYSKQHRRYIETDGATAKVEQVSKDARKFQLCIDGMPILEWFKQQWNLIQEKMKAARMSDKPKRSRGIRL